jgi:SecD/SecF fusion protein
MPRAPKEDAPAPKEDAPAPKEDAPAPKEDAPAPKEDAPAPKEDAPAPKEDAPAPKEDAPAPKEDAPAPEEEAAEPKEDAPAPSEDAPESGEHPTDPAADESLHFDRSVRSMFVSLDSTQWLLAMADPESETTAEPAAEQSESTEAPMADEAPPPLDSGAEPVAPAEEPAPDTTPADDSPEQPKQTSRRVVTKAVMKFGHNINGRTVQDQVLKVAETKGFRWTEEDVDLSPVPPQPDWIIDDSRGFTEWSVAVNGDEDDVRTVLTALRDKLADTPVWQSSNKIGGKVAGDTQTLAIAALLTSLIGIVIYIWIRFQRVVFGLAAVVALVHDVLIVLGAIAVSYWLAGVLGFLQIQEFKISLPVVAAILTIIGYSLNDTIVVFDRIREVRGKSPNLTADMLNTSLNQTLSRTLLTSFTTFLVVVILYFVGGSGVHDFAYCLVVGVVVGTYSSIYVAAPVLLWMSQPSAAGK